MGRAALFLVLGLAVALAVISFTVSQSGNRAVEAQTGYMKYTAARNLAQTAVHVALRALDKNESPPAEPVPFHQGTYSIPVTTQSADTVWLTTVGTYAETTYTMNVTLLRDTKPFPTVNGAIGIRATPADFTTNGKASVDGRNYDATGTTLTGSGDKAGVTTWTVADSAAVKAALGSNAFGNPPVDQDTTTANPLEYIDEYIANADYTYSEGTYGAQTWGDASNPKIVVCDAGDDTTKSVKFTSAAGYGILAVRGSLVIAGNFEFHGLVVVYGQNNIINFQSSGTPQIVGGLIVAGTAGAALKLNGTGSVGAKIKYSSDALQNARNIGRLRFYRVLSWYER